jgi:hypothetical protein
MKHIHISFSEIKTRKGEAAGILRILGALPPYETELIEEHLIAEKDISAVIPDTDRRSVKEHLTGAGIYYTVL